mgnify:CR=1 FL=1
MIIIALAFLLPVIITLIVMAVCGVVPFGNKSTMIWDSLLQYKDYYGYLWDVFHGNAGIEYSTGKALGGRMIGIVAYYLSSPLNLFIVFFSKGADTTVYGIYDFAQNWFVWNNRIHIC